MSDKFQGGMIKYSQQRVLSELVGRLQLGMPLEPWYAVPSNAQEMSNLAGALNFWAVQPSLPVVVVSKYFDGEGRRVMTFYPDQIIAVPFTVGAGPWASPHGYASSAEYGAAPGMRSASLSRTPGDMSGASQGMGVTLDFQADTMAPGTYYYNCHMLPEFPPTQSGFSVAFPH